MKSKIEQIQDLISFGNFISPLYTDKKIIDIQCRIEYEPFGYASDTWEEMWELKLPYVQSYWKGTKGYNSRIKGICYSAIGSSLESVLDITLIYLRTTPIEIIKIENK